MMGLLLSPLGRALGALVAVVALAWGIYAAGEHAERAKCEAGALRAELAVVRADLDAAHRAAQNAKALSHMLSELDKKNQELADEIASSPDGCRASQSDVDRLRRLK